MTFKKALLAAAFVLGAMPVQAHGPKAGGEAITPAFEHALPNAPGKTLTSIVVSYKPGGKSGAHTHSKTAFVWAYVLSGSIRSQVNDGPVKVYHAGESWYEEPGAHHQISENASKTRPASLLAVFVADTGDQNLTVFEKDK